MAYLIKQSIITMLLLHPSHLGRAVIKFMKKLFHGLDATEVLTILLRVNDQPCLASIQDKLYIYPNIFLYGG